MAINKWLPDFLRDPFEKLTKAESLLLKASIFVRVCEKMFMIFEDQHQDYLKLLKDHGKNNYLEINLLPWLINDILSTEEYTLEGIANFIRMPIDVLIEVISGINRNPSLRLATNIISLHLNVRPTLYNELLKKILNTP